MYMRRRHGLVLLWRCGDFWVVVSVLSADVAAAIVGFVSLIDSLHRLLVAMFMLGDALIDRVDLVFAVCLLYFCWPAQPSAALSP
jgi:hypothetical protein